MSIYYFLYSVFTGVGIFLLSPYFLLKGMRHRKYLQNLPERLAWRFPAGLASRNGAAPGAIWVHAVSVGEVLAAVPLARLLKERFPERRLVISTTTATGQAIARERMHFADAVFYFPLDWRGPVRRALRTVRPGLAIILETEIWPNFLRETRRAGVPVLFVNGRISDRSFARFSRSLRLSGGLLHGFLRSALHDAMLYLTQSPQDSARLIALGAPAERVIVAGNMKYDLAPPSPNSLVKWLGAELARTGRGPLLVAGSIIAGEEAVVLEALAAVEKIWPNALLVLAPRKPERFDTAAAIVEQAGWRVVRRSTLLLESGTAALECVPGGPRSVLMLDTIGELAAVYALADVVFIGGSLQPSGGHNPLEPAAVGKAPVFGTAMDNFREIASGLLAADAAIQVRSGGELGAAWIALLSDDGRRARMGSAARKLVEQNRGATAVTLGHVAALLARPQAGA